MVKPRHARGFQPKRKADASPQCYICKKPLTGFRRVYSSHWREVNRSETRVWRPYDGQVFSNCLKTALRQAARTA